MRTLIYSSKSASQNPGQITRSLNVLAGQLLCLPWIAYIIEMIKYAKDCKSLCGKKGTMPTIEVYTHEDSMYYLLVHESEQTPGDSDGQGSLAHFSSWDHKESDMTEWVNRNHNGAAAAKLLQSCLTLCDPRDGSPPGFPVPGILQARALERVAISFSYAWKWKVQVNSLSRVRL